ncbi:hypothetical protein [Streptococcus thoraltensis]|uniref:hypothetical protein n=1 Tax=Streptococcus thoraltensis TaxID=55085 RepID=UPI00035E9F3A|nr:hypothetical protein [Streptococcus thoraltensis]MDY4761866.1 hypothetical protein [Streptococcus thoraltensis]
MKKLSLVGFFAFGLGLVFLIYRLVAPPTVEQKQQASYDTSTEQFIVADDSETLSKMTSKQAGIYFYGFPECPWCQELLPIVNDALQGEKASAYVVDIHGNSYSEEDAATLKTFYQLNVKQKEVLVPFLVFINQEGQVKTHVGTIEGHNAKKEKMTKNQREELMKALRDLVIWSQS